MKNDGANGYATGGELEPLFDRDKLVPSEPSQDFYDEMWENTFGNLTVIEETAPTAAAIFRHERNKMLDFVKPGSDRCKEVTEQGLFTAYASAAFIEANTLYCCATDKGRLIETLSAGSFAAEDALYTAKVAYEATGDPKMEEWGDNLTDLQSTQLKNWMDFVSAATRAQDYKNALKEANLST